MKTVGIAAVPGAKSSAIDQRNVSDPTDVEALCFDMYCTTHDTHSVKAALRRATDRPEEVIDRVSHLWRETKIDLSRKIALMDETGDQKGKNYVTWWELPDTQPVRHNR